MTSQLGPILSALLRHRTAALIIVLEMALTCAIVCNVVFMIVSHIEQIRMPSGIVENEISYLMASSDRHTDNKLAITTADLSRLRSLSGVREVTLSNQIPFGMYTTTSGIELAPDQSVPTLTATVYAGDEKLVGTFGLRLQSGRNFNSNEVQEVPEGTDLGSIGVPSAIISKSAAVRLFPRQEAVGATIYISNDRPVRIIGVIDRLIKPSPIGQRDDEFAVVLPIRLNYKNAYYILRSAPDSRERVIQAAHLMLTQSDSRRVIDHQGLFTDLRTEYFRADVATVWLLTAVCLVMLLVTALGIVGLANFWVQQRTITIGIRRALGATRGDILRYFQLENALLTLIGTSLGLAGAYGVNQVLMMHYEMQRLPAIYLPAGAILLFVLGQAAVFVPAKRASCVPPALAMRTLAK